MPIVDNRLRGRLPEIVRIRLGEKKTKKDRDKVKTFPSALTTFRITSPSRRLITKAAELWGGEAQIWNDERLPAAFWQVTTEASALPCLLLPEQLNAFTQWFEMWTGAGCQRRCDGDTEILSGKKCMCPFDLDERMAQAAELQPRACKPVTRLNVMLPDLAHYGVARLESHGYNALAEIAATVQLHAAAAAASPDVQFLPAELRIERRSVRRPGQATKNFVVPVVAIPELPAITAARRAALGKGAAELPGGSGAAGELAAGASETDEDEVIVDPDDEAHLTVELTTSDHYASAADWKEMLKGSGITQAGLIRKATEIAKALGQKQPAKLEDLVDADLASRLARWLNETKSAKAAAVAS